MLTRVQGSGNYVRAIPNPASVYAMFRLELQSGGGLPTARVLSVDRMTKDPTLPRFGTSHDAHRIRRLRYLSGVVAAVEEIWLDGDQVDKIGPGELSESLYLYYRQRLGLWIARADDSIGQGPVPDWAPAEFAHPPGTPLPKITRISYAPDGTAVEASLSWFDPNTVRYVARLK
jgi:GntR family transcriptional regulator